MVKFLNFFFSFFSSLFSNNWIYILVDGFREKKEIRGGDMDKKQVLRFQLLEQILFLADLHSNNYGVDFAGNLYIVDFQVLFLGLFSLPI